MFEELKLHHLSLNHSATQEFKVVPGAILTYPVCLPTPELTNFPASTWPIFNLTIWGKNLFFPGGNKFEQFLCARHYIGLPTGQSNPVHSIALCSFTIHKWPLLSCGFPVQQIHGHGHSPHYWYA